jgi:L-threonylcarbamoyladenylate synthase
VPDAVTAGRALVGIRMPAHPVALELIRRAGVPVAAPSANLFSHTSPTTADHVLADLDGQIDAVLDAGPTLHGLESTVLDPCQSPMILYRPGAVTIAQVEAVAGAVQIFEPSTRDFDSSSKQVQQALPAPGVGLRHYAPRARLVLVDTDRSAMQTELNRAADADTEGKIGVMLPGGMDAPEGVSIFPWGDWESPEELGQRLFAGLRQLDAEGCSVILCPIPSGEGIGAAIRDRLRKAARSK